MLKKARYRTIGKLLKLITPELYRKFNKETFESGYISLSRNDKHIKIRPAISFMKKHFKNKELIGAEIGVARGVHALSILDNLNISKLYLIDIWKSIYDELRVKYLFENNPKVKIIKGKSLDVVKTFEKDLDFVYIDGSHIYYDVYNDIKEWSKQVNCNGIVSGHDILTYNLIHCSEVLPALENYCLNNNVIAYLESPDWYFRKNDD